MLNHKQCFQPVQGCLKIRCRLQYYSDQSSCCKWLAIVKWKWRWL